MVPYRSIEIEQGRRANRGFGGIPQTPYRDALMMMGVIHSRCWLEAVSVEAMEHPFKFQIDIEFHILLQILQM